MNNKVGRPTVPKREAKVILRGAQYSAEELKAMELERAKTGLDKSKWMRDATQFRVENPPIWVKSKWKRTDLDGKLIEFRLRSPERELSGVGEMKVRENSRGQIAVDIFIDEHPTPYEGIVTRIWLSQEAVDRIELNPNPEPAKFRLLG